ncbi:WD40 repeat-like protein [Rhizopus microsporus var. microsporus]|uniref:WD40 repeat-like protein n=1 Tax=Rhizopus microsporus var. microsporus TaxID=86635 RepID=A0A1X0RAL4_RHIZD|nr:WD40 repeat-like protein [Rhizopus microsporus var. microsporus]
MIIFKPDWVSHAADKTQEAKGKKPCIYSIHVHPDGTRLATGGLDGKVRIWNTEPIYDEEAEKNPNCNKLLCTMTMHNGAVLCVRWSNHDGHYLASGSDNDNVIIVWEKDVNAKVSSIFDVQDLAWSKDNKYLASCGVDGHVIVWDGKTFEQIKKIDKHEGFVKGISWDPAGKYLASQSDDKMVKIWRTYDWGLETNIKNPFVNAPGTTLFRSIKCVAAIVSRDDWNADISLVGHKLPVEVTCFNPKMFYMSDDNEANGPGEKSVSSICALGSQDRSISIWVTKFSKPICVAADIFDNNVYDLAWSPDGKCLFACSQDGTVACLQFEEELSDVVPENIVVKRLERYGYGKDQTQLLETPIQLELEQTTDTEPALPPRVADLMDGNASIGNQDTPMIEAPPLTPAPPNITNISSSTSQQPTILEQKVSITKDGKKRIQPISLNMRTSTMHSPSTVQAPLIQTQPMNHISQGSSKINQAVRK